jgi:dienelactone hydrolase
MKQETDLEAMYRLFTWRITSNYVPHWDFARMKDEIAEWDEWCSVWSRYAARHGELGRAALADGDGRAAGAHYVRAALFYHWASFVFTHRLDEFRAALDGMAEVWRAAAPHTDPPMELVDVPFEGTPLPGYLRKPNGLERPPVAVLVPGADSTKEELFNLSEHIVERGVATFAFDGPGHGAVSFHLKLRPDYEVPIGAVIDQLEQRDDLDTSRLGVCGISYGGLFACRAAALDERVKAAVSMSSWYTPAGRYRNQDHISQVGLRQYMGDDPAAVQDAMTLEGVAEKLTVPLLQIYGGRDPASPPEHAYRTEAEANGPTTTLVFKDGVHVCNNLWFEVRPRVGHWLARQLGVV